MLQVRLLDMKIFIIISTVGLPTIMTHLLVSASPPSSCSTAVTTHHAVATVPVLCSTAVGGGAALYSTTGLYSSRQEENMTVCTCRQWRQFSCVTDTQCREWNTGDRCCQGGRCCYQEEEEVTNEVTEEVTEKVIEDVTEGSAAKVKEDLSVKTNNANNVREKLIETPNSKEDIIVNTKEDTTLDMNVKESNITVQTLQNENESEENRIKGIIKTLILHPDCILLDLIEVLDETTSVRAVEEDFQFSDFYFNKSNEAENNARLVSLPFIIKSHSSSSLALLAVHKLWWLCVLILHWMR